MPDSNQEALAAIEAHFNETAQDVRQVSHPAIINPDTGNPVVFHVWPLTVDEAMKIQQSATALGGDSFSVLLATFMVRAKLESGIRMFTIGDRTQLRRQLRPETLADLVREINADLAEVDAGN